MHIEFGIIMSIVNRILIFTFMFIFTIKIYAKDFSIPELTETALSEDCIDYCVDGICFWLKCSLWGCWIVTTPHISHNLPDLVVTSYKNPSENPFLEVKALDIMPNIDGGELSSTQVAKKNKHLKFREASVVGNPVSYALSRAKYFCPSKVKPYMPYYLSTLDSYLWRSGLTELIYPSTYTPGMNEVGPLNSSWGSIYPRAGFLVQSNDVRNAAVIAERALAIVSEPFSPHVSKHTPGKFKTGGKWQMIVPKAEKQCVKFGYQPQSWLEERIDEDSQYGWTAWHRYSCCIPGPGSLIGTTITGCLN